MDGMTTGQAWYALFLVSGVAGVVTGALLVLRFKKQALPDRIAATIGLASIVFAWSFFILFIAFANFSVPAESLVLSPEGKIVKIFPEERVFWPYTWKWAELNRQGKIVSYAAQRKEESQVFQPISENPKVRNLRYTVSIFIMGSPESYIKYKAAVGDNKVDKFLKYWLYEFQEQHGRQLSGFYNPLSEEQQKKFELLVRNFLETHLESSGMRFGNAKFTL